MTGDSITMKVLIALRDEYRIERNPKKKIADYGMSSDAARVVYRLFRYYSLIAKCIYTTPSLKGCAMSNVTLSEVEGCAKDEE